MDMRTNDQETTTQMTCLVTPDMANFSGKMHGGELLRFLDQVAYTCAMRYCGKYVVTISVDNVTFKQPIYIGELITAMATVNYTGRSSMEIGIKVLAENINKKSTRHTHTCYFTMVAVDEEGKPTSVKTLNLTSASQERRWNKAAKRVDIRKTAAKMMEDVSKS